MHGGIPVKFLSITAGMTMNVWVHMGLWCWCAPDCAHYTRVFCSFRPVCDTCTSLYMFVPTVCVFSRLCALCARVGEHRCFGISPAAKGLERWHPLKWSRSICECVCVILRSYQRWIGWELCVLGVWKGIGSDYRTSRHQINSNPHKRGKKWKKGAAVKREEEAAAVVFSWEWDTL